MRRKVRSSDTARRAGSLVLAALTTLLSLTLGAAAQPAEVAAASPLAAGDQIQRSGARSHDVTGDGWPDIVAREPGLNDGTLWIYTHSGVFRGQTTFSAKTLVGTGWNMHNWIGVAEVTGDIREPETSAEAPADIVARRAEDGALLVYPHSGIFNGTATWQAPVLIGLGWNGMANIVLADVTADGFDDILAHDFDGNLWVYPHSGIFNGTSTFQGRFLVGQKPLGWLLATEWHRENPDLITTSLATGNMTMFTHTQQFNGTGTYSATGRQVAAGIFSGSTTTSISMCDLNGDGEDDALKRTPDGNLLGYPYLPASSTLGPPVSVGLGWQIMDLIT
jgi:hypothetical protein